MAAETAPSKDPRDPRASPKVRGLKTDLKTRSGGKPAGHQKAIPKAHLTFVIDCAHGKRISLTAPPVPPRAPSPNPGPVIPPMKTYILFVGKAGPPIRLQRPPWMREALPGPGAPCHPAQGVQPQLPPLPAHSASRRLLKSRGALPRGLQLGERSWAPSKPSPPASVRRLINRKSLAEGGRG
uniref:Steroid receptor associated and regulated protein n=1 Tax=Sus scrofa TaxID=9823 RepID=A0A4X1W7M2_PIG